MDIHAEREKHRRRFLYLGCQKQDFPLFHFSSSNVVKFYILLCRAHISTRHSPFKAVHVHTRARIFQKGTERERTVLHSSRERERERERESFNAPRDAKSLFFLFYYSLRRNFFSTLSVFCEATSSLQKKKESCLNLNENTQPVRLRFSILTTVVVAF